MPRNSNNKLSEIVNQISSRTRAVLSILWLASIQATSKTNFSFGVPKAAEAAATASAEEPEEDEEQEDEVDEEDDQSYMKDEEDEEDGEDGEDEDDDVEEAMAEEAVPVLGAGLATLQQTKQTAAAAPARVTTGGVSKAQLEQYQDALEQWVVVSSSVLLFWI
eukprot:COSAG05_NODE_112_length_18489_cov_15.556281_6_plen_163_part_00